jgi:flagellar biosynthetic protein FliO
MAPRDGAQGGTPLSPYASYLLETLLTLVGVCGLAAFVLYGARRIGVGRATGGLELVGRLPLDARRSIVLVKIGETVFIVGVGDGGMTKLGEVAASAVPSPAVVASKGFATVLAEVLGRGAKAAAPVSKEAEK